jgi:ribonuclease D
MPDFQYVDIRDDNLRTEIAAADRIGVDTEFMREKTFYSQLCLLQISLGKDIYCADPLLGESSDDAETAGFWQALVRPAWVLHSGRQDMEVVYQASNSMPEEVFDTQVAAALLGYQPQIGYANLVAELFSVELAKSHTRADWSRRPLADAVMDYAAEDVLYLLPAYEMLGERLEKLGRLQWAMQDSADMLDVALYANDPALAINRLKAAGSLRGSARAAAVRLAAWREREAIRTNRPRQWILRDPVLLDLACSHAATKSDLSTISGLAERTISRAGLELLQILDDARNDELDYEPPPRSNEKQKALQKEMQRRVSGCAEELGIATEIIAPKKELSAAVLGVRDSRVFRGWRKELVGSALLELLGNG